MNNFQKKAYEEIKALKSRVTGLERENKILKQSIETTQTCFTPLHESMKVLAEHIRDLRQKLGERSSK